MGQHGSYCLCDDGPCNHDAVWPQSPVQGSLQALLQGGLTEGLGAARRLRGALVTTSAASKDGLHALDHIPNASKDVHGLGGPGPSQDS